MPSKKAVRRLGIGVPCVAGPPAEGKPETRKPAAGLECRTCGCRHFEVVDVRAAYGGRIRRRRECRHCRRRLTTYETPAG